MPLTILHYGVAYLIGKWKQSVSFPGLIVSSMMSDVERLIYLFTDNPSGRGLLHSLFGVATLGTAISFLFTIYAYPAAISVIFKVEKKKTTEKCRFSKGLFAACLSGGVLHVLVDSLHHEFNPTLYPFMNDSFDAFVLFSNWQLATIIVYSVFSMLFFTIFVWEAVKGTEGFWNRVLVD